MKDKKLNLFLLITLIIGTIIGGGIFNSPTDLILKANPLSAVLAWLLGGFGVLMLTLVFYELSIYKPELTGVSIPTLSKDLVTMPGSTLFGVIGLVQSSATLPLSLSFSRL